MGNASILSAEPRFCYVALNTGVDLRTKPEGPWLRHLEPLTRVTVQDPEGSCDSDGTSSQKWTLVAIDSMRGYLPSESLFDPHSLLGRNLFSSPLPDHLGMGQSGWTIDMEKRRAALFAYLFPPVRNLDGEPNPHLIILTEARLTHKETIRAVLVLPSLSKTDNIDTHCENADIAVTKGPPRGLFADAVRAWRIDPVAMRFIEIPKKGVRCCQDLVSMCQ